MRANWAGQNCLLVLDRGEELVSSLKQFAEHHKIASAVFNGLGGSDRVKVGTYSEATNGYLYTDYKIHLEISSLTGNILMYEGKPFVHVHGVFSGSGGLSFGGHVAECEVSPVCEIHLTKLAEITAARMGTLPLPRISGS